MSTPRTALVRLAAQLPKGSAERRSLLATLKEGRIRTKSESADKAAAAMALVDSLQVSGRDVQLVPKILRLLEEIIDIEESSGFFA